MVKYIRSALCYLLNVRHGYATPYSGRPLGFAANPDDALLSLTPYSLSSSNQEQTFCTPGNTSGCGFQEKILDI